MTAPPQRSRHRGFTLIEILIALIVLAFGLLSLARVMGRSSQGELEAFQRMQAMSLVQDMVDRINSNRKQAANYVTDYSSSGSAEDCAQLEGLILQDQCEWRNRLRGIDVLDGVVPIGAPIAAVGCITSPSPNVYVVAVAWQGVVPTAAPDSPCGGGLFDREENRRVYSTVVQIGQLGS